MVATIRQWLAHPRPVTSRTPWILDLLTAPLPPAPGPIAGGEDKVGTVLIGSDIGYYCPSRQPKPPIISYLRRSTISRLCGCNTVFACYHNLPS